MNFSTTSGLYMPSLAERAQIRLDALMAAKRAREHGIIDPETQEKLASWRSGSLRWKLDPKQQELYDFLLGLPVKQGVIEGARKLGKTFLFGCVALETAIRNPGKQINWSCGTITACRKILVPILTEISADAPPECKGRYDQGSGQWKLPNGAFIQIFGAETQRDCEKGRGPSSILNIVDEAGFVDLLEYLTDSIFSPQLRRVRRVAGTFIGLTLMCSTTPYTPTHPFCKIADAAAAIAAYAKRTIYDSGFETLEEIEQYIAGEAAKKNMTVESFKASSTFRREYMSERVVDTEKVVFPEWVLVGADGLTGAQRVVKEWPRPVGFDQFIHKRTAADPGGTRDPTGVLAGYVDFTNAKVVVEGERLLPKPNTHEIFESVVELETSLWGPPPDPPPGQPYLDRSRISRPIDDPTGRVCLDLWEIDKLHCEPAVKNDRNASVGLIRTWLVDGTLIIHPRCVQLQHQLHTALNNKQRTDFERNAQGHCDLAAALMYFCRGLSLTANPYPAAFDALTGRSMPDHHPVMSRREQMGQGKQAGGLVGAILSGNKFVAGQLRRRR